MLKRPSFADISIVIPCYNAGRWVSRAIDSVLAQEGVSVEVIVIDDGSTDGSLGVLHAYKDRIRWETGPNLGACSARNRGLALASAEYVMFLDADDYLLSSTAFNLISSLEKESADLCIGTALSENLEGERRKMPAPNPYDAETFLFSWLIGNWVPPCAVMWRKQSLCCLGGWNETLSKHQDSELMLRAAARRAKLVQCDHAVSIYFEGAGPARISQNKSERATKDILKARRLLLDEIEGTELSSREVRMAISGSLHKLEAKSAIDGHDEVRYEISLLRKKLGAPKYQGTKKHIYACYILGLSRKEKLSKFIHSVIKAGRHWNRLHDKQR